jgi:hypothetical protein
MGPIYLTFRKKRYQQALQCNGLYRRRPVSAGLRRKNFVQLSHQEQDIINSFEGQKSYTKNPIQIDYQEKMQEAA